MVISIRRRPNDHCLELGGGSQPLLKPTCQGGNDICLDARMCHDPQGKQTVDFTADFEQPLPLRSDEFDGAISVFCFEHVSYTKLPQLVAETFRVLKTGSKIVLALPNTAAQFQWIVGHPEGWDGKPLFTAASELLFGTQDYQNNAHKCYLTPSIITSLLAEAGFEEIHVDPYGERGTDMIVQAIKPNVFGTNAVRKEEATVLAATIGGQGTEDLPPLVLPPSSKKPTLPPAETFDKAYFNGGYKVGGYTAEGYRDFLCHHITARHILDHRPESVLELGCARGYVLKILQDAGIVADGLEVSHHCYLTRACDSIIEWDLLRTPWPVAAHDYQKQCYDLCFSIAVLEHVPEDKVPDVIKEMARTCKRGLHGIDFGEQDDGQDLTHICLKSRDWWLKQFAEHAPGWPVTILSKEQLEQGQPPLELIQGDGKVKVQIGPHLHMSYFGWDNYDIADLEKFAQANGYRFARMDVRWGLPYPTGSVDLIFSSHFLEHLSRREGLAFLRDCRRCLKPDGVIRVLTPDFGLLARHYIAGTLNEFDEISDTAAATGENSTKLWELAQAGHLACYDKESIVQLFREAGFVPEVTGFRQSRSPQLLKETIDQFPALSLITEGVPQLA